MPTAIRRRWLVALSALVLAFGLLGAHGLWDPDEGRYSNVALNMLDSGDWLTPRRNDAVEHWTKPPLTYWAVAGSVAAFGPHPWAVRLPSALAYLLTALLAWRLARRLVPGGEDMAALGFIGMLVPFAASQVINTDSLLMLFETLAMLAFVEARFGDDAHARHWNLMMWAAFALAFLTKGPPGLLPLLAMLGFDWAVRDGRRHRVFSAAGLATFLLLGLPWYAAVTAGTPGLLAYFLGDEVMNRIASDAHDRNGQWYGWLAVYLPVLLLGTLPWTRDLIGAVRDLPIRAWWKNPAGRRVDAPRLLLWLWIALPLLVFCVSRSRMPLYLLPLFVPIALLVAMRRRDAGKPFPRWPWMAAWIALLLAVKIGMSMVPSHKDAGAWAETLRARSDAPVRRVLFVDDMARYGLHLHLGIPARIERIVVTPYPQPRFNPSYDETPDAGIAESADDPSALWVTRQAEWPRVAAALQARGTHARALGAPYQGRVVFRVLRRAPPPGD